ncbi:hypothetical protein KAU32_04425 [bacterium]|nr:hypothetical protein [bacterium]
MDYRVPENIRDFRFATTSYDNDGGRVFLFPIIHYSFLYCSLFTIFCVLSLRLFSDYFS